MTLAATLLLCVAAGFQIGAANVTSPLVLVPGILGSQLWGKLNRTSVPFPYCTKVSSGWYNMWLNFEELLPLVVNCLSDNIMLRYSNETGQYGNTPGVETKVPGFGDTSSIEFLDPARKWFEPTQYFYALVQHFVEFGYERGKTIRAAPYDWRFSADALLQQGYYDNLRSLIENTYQLAGNAPVTLVVHSLGAPTSLFFLTKVVDQAWKDTYIKAYVTLSGAWRGAAKVAMAFISGDNEGIFIDRPIWGREAQRSYLSTAWLLPYPSDTWTEEDILVVTGNKNYSSWDYYDLFNDIDYPLGYAMFEQVVNLTAPLPPPGVPTYCYYGADVKTPLQFIYRTKGFPNEQPTILYGLGDGTVNDNSLTSCEKWKDQQTQPVTLKAFSGVEHVSMLKSQPVIQAVQDIVYS
eukprot:Em0018g1059a